MTKPRFSIAIDKTPGDRSNSARFVIEPLPQGFGHTLGNSLRRVLYSSIPGAAITSLTVSGAPHQFSSLDGVQEDVVQLILGLKKVRVTYAGSEPVPPKAQAP